MLPKLEDLTVSAGITIREALVAIEKNAQGLVFAVTPEQKLVGVATDGDVRRALINGVSVDGPLQEIMNKKFVSFPVDTPNDVLVTKLSEDVSHLPLVDKEGKLVDFACLHRMHQIPVMEPFLNGNELNYVVDCVKTRWISSQGKYVTKFEKMFSDLHDQNPSVAVSNGTVALHLAMLALGIGPGDEVIVPNLTFAASINAVLYLGATPVIVDVEPTTWCIDPKEVEKHITPKTKAIMPVHLYGQPCDMDAIMSIAKKHNLFVVEDAAEAMGALYKGKPAGSIGDVGCFSFFGNKLVTTGEGGMVICKDPQVAERARMLRDHGMSKEKRYWHLEVGYNYRMTNLQAAIGVAQLEQYDQILERKINLAKKYRAALSECSWMQLPPEIKTDRSVYWLFTVVIKPEARMERSELMQKLAANGIETRPVFFPLHVMPPYEKYAKNQTFPVTDLLSSRGLSLPSSAMLDDAAVDRICSTLKQVVSMRQWVQSSKN